MANIEEYDLVVLGSSKAGKLPACPRLHRLRRREIMAVVQVAMRAGLPYTAIGDMVLTHPTIAEGLGELFTGPVSA
jgi:hypothetical protein